MTIEEMLNYLGVRTQSKESIDLCYKMDMEAFNMMTTDENDFSKERYKYNCVYYNLLDELNYKKLDEESKKSVLKEIEKIDITEEDKEYRNQFFTGLERILLRYNRADLVGYQRIKESSFEGMAKDAYLYEQAKNYEMAILYYNKLGFTQRALICKVKMSI